MNKDMPTTEAYVARHDGVKLEKVTYDDLAADEVLVEIVGASVCHSDVRASQGTFHMKPPLILGHEGAGYVNEIGSGVTYVKPGDAVVLAFCSCGQCRRCNAGRQPYCEKIFPLNFSGTREDGRRPVKDSNGKEVNGLFFGQSSMSRLALVREGSCVKVEGSWSRRELSRFASLGCGLQTGAGVILNIALPPPGSSIVVFGAGAVGLSAILAARSTQPACLILVDNNPAKLDMIPTELIRGVQIIDSKDLSEENLVQQLKQATPGERGMDFALDCVGHEAVSNAAYLSLGTLGTLFTIGGSATARPTYAIERNLVNGLTIRGTHQGDSVPRIMIPELIRRWQAGDFPFHLLQKEYKFEELHQAIDDMHRGKVIKPLLVT